MADGGSEPSGWSAQYASNVQSSASSDGESPTKMREKLMNAGVGNSASQNDSDESGSPSKPSSLNRKDSRSSRSRSRRSSSRHRHDKSRRSRSGSRHRRRRSSSRGRRHRSRSNSHKRSRSRSRRRSPKRSSQDSTKERSRSRSRSTGKRENESRDRSRTRDRRRRSRSRGRRSTSRSRRRGSRSKRSGSRERRRRRSRSRGKRHRRSRSPRNKPNRDAEAPAPYRFGHNRAMDAQERLARRLERARELTKMKKEEDEKNSDGFLGSKDDKLKDAIEKAAKMLAGSAPVSTIPHEAMSARATAQMSALRQQAEAETGVHVPSYYNPLVVNPMMFAQQQAKRNLLWSKKEPAVKVATQQEQSAAVWTKTSLGDEKSDEKFAKLMGIKQNEQLKANPPDEDVKKRQELFSNLDIQYQQARVVTHTQRGAGLGFASSNPNTLLAQQAHQQLNPAASFPPQT